MEKQYIKVLVENENPEMGDYYDTNKGELYYLDEHWVTHDVRPDSYEYPKWWLKEVVPHNTLNNGWISVNERLPELGALYNVIQDLEDGYPPLAWSFMYDKTLNKWLIDDSEKEEFGITHWQELPSPFTTELKPLSDITPIELDEFGKLQGAKPRVITWEERGKRRLAQIFTRPDELLHNEFLFLQSRGYSLNQIEKGKEG